MTADSTPSDVLSGDARWCVVHGDCIDVMRSLPDNSVDAVVTDAPYGLTKISTKDATEALSCWLRGEPYLKKRRGFMSRTWDSFVPGPEVWRECLRILKPGGYLLTFSGTRTVDLMGVALRLAGFEIRDSVAWIHSQGMAKSVNLERHVAMHECQLPGRHFASTLPKGKRARDGDHLCPSTEESLRWKGQGSALAPSHEPIIVARKPLAGTHAETALEFGTALNIDATRIAHANEEDFEAHKRGVEAIKARGGEMDASWKNSSDLSGANEVTTLGRWAKNTVFSHDPCCKQVGSTAVAANPTWDTPNRDTQPSAFTGKAVSKVRHGRDGQASAEKRYSDAGSTSFAATPGARRDAVEELPVYECGDGCPLRMLEEQSGIRKSGGRSGYVSNVGLRGNKFETDVHNPMAPSAGTAARYFQQFHASEFDEPFRYQAKPSRREKDSGLEHFRRRRDDGNGARNIHPTSKPVALVRWLTKLVARTGQVVFNPFAGGGSEGIAAVLEGCRWIGAELMDTDDEPFVSIAKARLTHLDGGSYVPRESLRGGEAEAQQGALFGKS